MSRYLYCSETGRTRCLNFTSPEADRWARSAAEADKRAKAPGGIIGFFIEYTMLESEILIWKGHWKLKLDIEKGEQK